TGTNGKTSTAHILTQILSKTGQKTAVLGTTGIRTDNYSALMNNTTPAPLVLQNVFQQMVDLDVENMIMEVSSIGLAEERKKLIFQSLFLQTSHKIIWISMVLWKII